MSTTDTPTEPSEVVNMSGWDNGFLVIPYKGREYWFEDKGWNTVTLSKIELLDCERFKAEGVPVSIPGDGVSFEDLPAPVRKALGDHNVRFKTSAETVVGCM